ncbi:MAG: hypothetical protein LUO97_06695 [Methanomicrobiales archaeon]|nr:hypothetical protein [Methanomicrobiales archaeon]MDD1669474.1 hypothetical protein [Methanomicrobiales archaeon]
MPPLPVRIIRLSALFGVTARVLFGPAVGTAFSIIPGPRRQVPGRTATG